MILSSIAIMKRMSSNTSSRWSAIGLLLIAGAVVIGIGWAEAGLPSPASFTRESIDRSLPMMPMILLLFPLLQP